MVAAELENTVVLITRESHVRDAVSSTLEKAGFIILAASNTASVLDLCRKAAMPIRLAIVDVGFGQTEAPGFIQSLRQAAPGIRLIFISNSIEPENLEHWKGDRVLGKPFRRAHLLGTVLQVMSEPLAFTA
jgi:CheY-like chemotaxis protein